jgi:hypothetical protein
MKDKIQSTNKITAENIHYFPLINQAYVTDVISIVFLLELKLNTV